MAAVRSQIYQGRRGTEIDKPTMNPRCCIASYINNLNPQTQRPLYEVVENVFGRIIPFWDMTLSHGK
jgi:hypothetical protein